MELHCLGEGKSDPISYECTCIAPDIGGAVLLFYRYWDNSPRLPQPEQGKSVGLDELAEWHSNQTEKYNLSGKIRIAREGYNVTVAGTGNDIGGYIDQCLAHWSFAGLDLDTEANRNSFFKPTEGCACVFGPEKKASVRITAEITPMGIEGYMPSDWGCIEALSPEDFHSRCHEQKTLLLDVRNVYESRIGYFVNPQTGQPALRPPIRRFSQWPQYIEHHLQDLNVQDHKQIMTYCTGGIRCEKATRWMQEKADFNQGSKVCTLQGGIAAYLAWMDEEIRRGRKDVADSLFRGRNYVFDARGSTGLDISNAMEPVSKCHMCTVPTDLLSKCRSRGCHLVLVVCPQCVEGDPRCCQDCHDQDQRRSFCVIPRQICLCERQREAKLWGKDRVKEPKTQGWRKVKKKKSVVDHGTIIMAPLL